MLTLVTEIMALDIALLPTKSTAQPDSRLSISSPEASTGWKWKIFPCENQHVGFSHGCSLIHWEIGLFHSPTLHQSHSTAEHPAKVFDSFPSDHLYFFTRKNHTLLGQYSGWWAPRENNRPAAYRHHGTAPPLGQDRGRPTVIKRAIQPIVFQWEVWGLHNSTALHPLEAHMWLTVSLLHATAIES